MNLGKNISVDVINIRSGLKVGLRKSSE